MDDTSPAPRTYSILHETPGFIAVDKPPGLPVIPLREGDATLCLWRQLELVRHERLWVVHRLDKDTSGVVLFARNALTHTALSRAFETRRVHKSYHAFAFVQSTDLRADTLAQSLARIDVPLHTARKGRMRPALPGEESSLACVTLTEILARRHCEGTLKGELLSLSVEPQTGRQHQIRVHLRSVNVPLLVDPVYARRETLTENALGDGSPALSRLTLHAKQISLDAPDTDLSFKIEAPMPADMAALERWML